MSAQHTPGPWEVDEMLTVSAPSTLMVAECSCAANRPLWAGTDYSTRAHQKANARLIAAAPDLLDRLRDAVAIIDGAVYCGHELNDIGEERLTRCRAAIAKTTGSAS